MFASTTAGLPGEFNAAVEVPYLQGEFSFVPANATPARHFAGTGRTDRAWPAR